MYLYLGADIIVKKEDIVGIFELDGRTTSQITKEFLNYSQNNNILESAGTALPKSFVIVKNKNGEKVYFSHVSVSSLIKRCQNEELKQNGDITPIQYGGIK